MTPPTFSTTASVPIPADEFKAALVATNFKMPSSMSRLMNQYVNSNRGATSWAIGNAGQSLYYHFMPQLSLLPIDFDNFSGRGDPVIRSLQATGGTGFPQFYIEVGQLYTSASVSSVASDTAPAAEEPQPTAWMLAVDLDRNVYAFYSPLGATDWIIDQYGTDPKTRGTQGVFPGGPSKPCAALQFKVKVDDLVVSEKRTWSFTEQNQLYATQIEFGGVTEKAWDTLNTISSDFAKVPKYSDASQAG